MHDAEAGFLAAIAEDPAHLPSRQALLGLYLEAQRKDEAEIVARDGLKAGIRQPSWVMLLARLEADRGDLGGAVNTMQSHLDIGRQNGDYAALLAALLQKQGRHKEAVEQYQAAIALGAAKPAWFLGQGISLRELGRREEASVAFQRALDSGGLSGDLKLYVERQLAALRLPP
jgi:MSHA biogenesis protein MshN